ncbi:cupin domain-containing protein [Streptacidiphilus rugosus]|uniref:hypothetical protein n=1 Tax=Streptacidiphilus rugosus TaxID=405783 RepID=UPI000562B80C|nr:hypothetical protein [Streptacidiphilus rugosus]
MPRTAKPEAPLLLDEEAVEGRYSELDDYTVGFETFHQDVDPAPLFRGLPDDACQSPHWGVVLKGRMVFRYPDHDEVYHAGDAYYGAPGHVPLVFAGTEVVEFSPTAAMRETMAVVGRNLAAAQQHQEA